MSEPHLSVMTYRLNHDSSERTVTPLLVAQGYCQKFGQDYDEVFAPVIKQTTLRMLLAVASKHNLQLRHFDVKTAYLNGVLQEELYMKQPAGFEEQGKEGLVCRLRRSIYGLKHSARCVMSANNPGVDMGEGEEEDGKRE